MTPLPVDMQRQRDLTSWTTQAIAYVADGGTCPSWTKDLGTVADHEAKGMFGIAALAVIELLPPGLKTVTVSFDGLDADGPRVATKAAADMLACFVRAEPDAVDAIWHGLSVKDRHAALRVAIGAAGDTIRAARDRARPPKPTRRTASGVKRPKARHR